LAGMEIRGKTGNDITGFSCILCLHGTILFHVEQKLSRISCLVFMDCWWLHRQERSGTMLSVSCSCCQKCIQKRDVVVDLHMSK
jgi:hypothetical protein